MSPPGTEEASLDKKVEAFFRNLLEQSGTLTATTTAFEEIFQDGSAAARTSSEAVESMSKSFMELSSSEIGRLHGYEKIGAKSI